MALKPETKFIAAVHKYLPLNIYRLKLNLPFNSGVADCWYSGTESDLWVEFKWVPKVPVRTEIPVKLTALQERWLNDRYDEGRNVGAVVGTPAGAYVLLDGDWNTSISNMRDAITTAAVAQWIISAVG